MHQLKIHAMRVVADFIKASRLVHDQYCAAGLQQQRASRLRLFLKDFLESSTTFVAKRGGEIVGTALAKVCCPAGFPCSSLYQREIDALLSIGRKPMESTKFASLSNQGRGIGNMSLIGTAIIKSLYTWCHENEISDWLVVINPRLASFYTEQLGFELWGAEKSCPHVQGAPGILMRLPIREIALGKKQLPLDAIKFFQSELHGVTFSQLPAARFRPVEVLALVMEDLPIVDEADDCEFTHFFRTHPDVLQSIGRILSSNAQRQVRALDSCPQPKQTRLLPAFADVFNLKEFLEQEREFCLGVFALRSGLADLTEALMLHARSQGLEFRCQISDELPQAVLTDALRIRQMFVTLGFLAIEGSEAQPAELIVSVAHRSEQEVIAEFSVRGNFKKIPQKLFRFVDALGAKVSLAREDSNKEVVSVECAFLGDEHVDTLSIDSFVNCDSLDIPLRVLVVDDNAVARVLMSRLLKRWGCKVEVARSAEECLVKDLPTHFDLIFMDIQLPRLSGLDAVRIIRDRERNCGSPRMKVVALTALAMPADRERCLTAGMDDYLAKPVDPGAIKRVLVAAMCSCSNSRSLERGAEPGKLQTKPLTGEGSQIAA